jgi:hypothetical protein
MTAVSLGRRPCPRCGFPVRPGDLRLYDYRDGLLCVYCETAADRQEPPAPPAPPPDRERMET